MKNPSLLVLAGLALSFAVPAFAQQKDTVDPQLRQALAAFNKKENEAWDNNDAVALAALYTEDAILVNSTGPIHGREAIEKYYADHFQKMHFSRHLTTADQDSPHIIGTAGNEAWTNGGWNTTIKGQDWGPSDFKGNWVEIYRRDGDDWKIRLDIWNLTPAPAATPSPTASASNK
jgi:ketosteroid isomerase-like protein